MSTIDGNVCKHGWTTPPECPSCMAIELESLRQENSRLREALEHKTILLHGGTRLKLSEAQEALDAAMQIIEAVGTTGIYSRYQKAHEWMRRYYPAWA